MSSGFFKMNTYVANIVNITALDAKQITIRTLGYHFTFSGPFITIIMLHVVKKDKLISLIWLLHLN